MVFSLLLYQDSNYLLVLITFAASEIPVVDFEGGAFLFATGVCLGKIILYELSSLEVLEGIRNL